MPSMLSDHSAISTKIITNKSKNNTHLKFRLISIIASWEKYIEHKISEGDIINKNILSALNCPKIN